MLTSSAGWEWGILDAKLWNKQQKQWLHLVLFVGEAIFKKISFKDSSFPD